MHAILDGAGYMQQRLRRRCFQRLIARRVVNFQLITAAARENELCAVLMQKRVERRNIGAHGAG